MKLYKKQRPGESAEDAADRLQHNEAVAETEYRKNLYNHRPIRGHREPEYKDVRN